MSVLLRSVDPPATTAGPTTTAAPMAADAKPAPPEPLFSPRHVTAGALALGAVAAGVTGTFKHDCGCGGDRLVRDDWDACPHGRRHP